jgi:HEPN domain-containing protein
MDEAQETRQQELARLMLDKARQDLALVRVVAESPDVADEIVGFHAQQAIEKSIKAALTRRGREYRYTHDLSVLYSQAEDAGISPPGSLDDIDQFTDFAVQFRYALLQTQDLDRAVSAVLAMQFVEWAYLIVETPIQRSDEAVDSDQPTEPTR